MTTPLPPGPRSTHRAIWLVLHPLLTWGMAALALDLDDYPESLLAALAILFMLYPLALYLRWRGRDAYRARSYCYAVGIAFGGVLLFAGNALLIGMYLGSASWR